MRYKLIIGNKNYSSWSMRAWLLLRLADVPFEQISISLYQPDSRNLAKQHGGQTGLVPLLIDDELPIWDTLAITESLYEEHSQIWPQDYARRARARSYSGEVHSSFSALRDAMPVNTRAKNRVAQRTAAVDADIARISEIWTTAGSYAEGPWLFGSFCAADIMFAPVAARFQTYDVVPTATAKGYFEQLLSYPLVVEWFALGQTEPQVIERFELPRHEGDVLTLMVLAMRAHVGSMNVKVLSVARPNRIPTSDAKSGKSVYAWAGGDIIGPRAMSLNGETRTIECSDAPPGGADALPQRTLRCRSRNAGLKV